MSQAESQIRGRDTLSDGYELGRHTDLCGTGRQAWVLTEKQDSQRVDRRMNKQEMDINYR